jgi:GTP-binding protein LepA
MRIQQVRNFCIIAHVDHGKSTLADRLVQQVGAVSKREFRDQMLDSMDLERERGITIKASAINLPYEQDGVKYWLNLIDTPGHVDFSYEVSRSLAACEGAILLVDASQGIEAQTVANAYKAIDHNLAIVPVVNKIDLPQARPQEVAMDLAQMLGIDPAEVILLSAKTGQGVADVLPAVIKHIPPPEGDPKGSLRALIFDSSFDSYRGAVLYLRLFVGSVGRGDHITLYHANASYEVTEVGRFHPNMEPCDRLNTGDVGYCVASIRDVGMVDVGDTVILEGAATEPLPGYRKPQPMVFCGVYPADNQDYEGLREALGRLHLNDPSFTFEPERSEALGLGFRCGFLGLLHMEIVQERLERESNLNLVQTSPNVTYEVAVRGGEVTQVDNPSKLPDPGIIEELREPYVVVDITLPPEYISGVMKLAQDRRGVYIRTDYLGPNRMVLIFEMPLAEIIHDFHDKLKSVTRGYGGMEYEFIGYRPDKLDRLDILVGGKKVDALSQIIHRDHAYYRGREIVKRLKETIPRHQFKVSLQAAIGGRVLARDDISAIAKNVTAKCYGGDITRKRKLLEKQKEGKKRLRMVGQVEIPQEAFLAVVRSEYEAKEKR